ARQGDVGMIGPLLGLEPQGLDRRLRNVRLERQQLGRRVDAHPGHPRRAPWRKRAAALQSQGQRRKAGDRLPQLRTQTRHAGLVRLAEEQEGQVQDVEIHPAGLRQPVAQPLHTAAHLAPGRLGDLEGDEEPHDAGVGSEVATLAGAAASSRRRSISRAIWAENMRIRSRSPGNRSRRCSTSPSPGPATAMWTVPTGFSGVPPPGPATPVIPTPQSLPRWVRTPPAIARATGSETAPCSAIISAGTPTSFVLSSLL